MERSIIGLLACQEAEFINPVQSGVQGAAKKAGRHLVVFSTLNTAHHLRFDDTELSAGFAFDARNLDAMILAYPNPSMISYGRRMQDEHGMPVVIVARDVEGMPCIIPDACDGFRNMTLELIRRGHRRIVFIGGQSSQPHIAQRLQGFLDGMAEAGVACDPDQICEGGLNESAGFVNTRRMLDQRIPFTAILAANDLVAIGAIKALQQAKRRVPRDVAVIGYDNLLMCDYVRPALSSIDSRGHVMGRLALERVVAMLEGSGPLDTRTVVAVEPVQRASCGAPRTPGGRRIRKHARNTRKLVTRTQFQQWIADLTSMAIHQENGDALIPVLNGVVDLCDLAFDGLFLFDESEETISADTPGEFQFRRGGGGDGQRHQVSFHGPPGAIQLPNYLPRDAAPWAAVVFPLTYYRRPLGFLLLDLENEYHISFGEFATNLAFNRYASRLYRSLENRNRELDAARRAAEEAHRMKNHFIANISHEIRTPMNGILGMTQLALETPYNAEQKECLESVYSSATALFGLLNDMLDLSRIGAGRLSFDRIAFDLENCVRDSVESLMILARQKGLALTWVVDERVPRSVVGDPLRLRQVLINLVNNAIKFTAAGSVRVEAALAESSEDRNRVFFAVTDTGIGIPGDRIETVFDAFTQVTSAAAQGHGGCGLGLAIARDLVRLMEGEIGVESTEGAGSRFYFTACFGRAEADRSNGRESGRST